MSVLAFDTLRELAAGCGLTVLSVTGGGDLEADQAHLADWQERGFAAEMTFMKRAPGLLGSPRRLLASVESVVVVAVSYERAPRVFLPPGFGRVARYAWGQDYHTVLRHRLELLRQRVEEYLGRRIECRAFSDSVPLLERALASRAGLGFIGKNTMAIIPKEGSFFFLGEIVWNVQVEGVVTLPTAVPPPSRCGGCTRCLSGCPTGAFAAERVLDASRCISYLTIEKREALSLQERSWIGDWIFGCDICQEVCPFNFVPLKKRKQAALPELSAAAGVGPMLSLEKILGMRTADEFRAAFKGSPVTRAKREGLVRNAAVVAANTHFVEGFERLCEVAENDQSPMVRRHALWATASMASREGERLVKRVRTLVSRAEQSGEPQLEEESRMIRGELRKFA